ncbi:MAG: HAD family hydrolase [Kiloniellaceae bacterium]
MTPARPRALLFDWDNTLIDSWDSIHHALNVTLEAMGHAPWSFEETRARVRTSARDSFPRRFGARAPEAAEIFYRTFEADHLEKLRERDGAGDMLRVLAKVERLYLAVVSNKQGYLLRREVAHLGWEDYFDRLVGASDAARDKPASDAVELALAGSGLAPGPEVWFVGDTDIDMLCAVNAGCLPVLLRAAPPGRGEFGETPPQLHVTSCADVVEAVRAL